MRDAERRVGNVVERQARIESAHHPHRPAGMQHRIGVAVEAAGMEQRQQHELDGFGIDQRRNAEIDAVPEVHAVGDDRTLGMARRAGRVHDHGDVVVIERDRPGGGGRRRQRLLIGAVGALGVDLEAVPRNLRGLCGEALVVDQQGRRGVRQDVLQLGHGQPPVERQHDGAEPPAGELELEVFRAVGRQQGHSIAFGDATGRQCSGQPVGTPVQFGIGEPAA